MKRFALETEYDMGPCAVALGTFDGLHTGHQMLIRRTIEEAGRLGIASVVFTFDRHPFMILRPDLAPEPLLAPEERRARLEKMGLDAIIERPFTREFAALTPRAFAKLLRDALHPRLCVAGYNYTFGQRGAGNIQILKKLGGEMGFDVIEVPAVTVDGESVSSSRIRALLSQGRREEAERLLAFPQ